MKALAFHIEKYKIEFPRANLLSGKTMWNVLKKDWRMRGHVGHDASPENVIGAEIKQKAIKIYNDKISDLEKLVEDSQTEDEKKQIQELINKEDRPVALNFAEENAFRAKRFEIYKMTNYYFGKKYARVNYREWSGNNRLMFLADFHEKFDERSMKSVSQAMVRKFFQDEVMIRGRVASQMKKLG
jgi:hypothetical protein